MDESWQELERMAQAASANDALPKPTEEQIARWCNLFYYTPPEAFNLMLAQRADLTRTPITDTHWELVREEREALGHDRETYEHEQELGRVLKAQSATIPGENGEVLFLFRLGGLLGTKEKVKEVAGLEEDPKVVKGEGVWGIEIDFCVVGEDAKRKIDEWLAQARVVEKKDLEK